MSFYALQTSSFRLLSRLTDFLGLMEVAWRLVSSLAPEKRKRREVSKRSLRSAPSRNLSTRNSAREPSSHRFLVTVRCSANNQVPSAKSTLPGYQTSCVARECQRGEASIK